VRAQGTGGPAVGARAGIELPDPDAAPLVVRTWMPAPEPAGHHSPYCRSRCCGTWQLSLPQTLPTPSPVPLPGRGGQAPTLPRPRRTQAPVASPVASPASVRAAEAGLPVPCTGGCGAKVAASYVLATGQDWHRCCPTPAPSGEDIRATAGGAR
jgi:hypothetical protein